MENVCIAPSPSGRKAGTGATCVTQRNCTSLLQGRIRGPSPADPISNFRAGHQQVPAQPLTSASVAPRRHPLLSAEGTAVYHTWTWSRRTPPPCVDPPWATASARLCQVRCSTSTWLNVGEAGAGTTQPPTSLLPRRRLTLGLSLGRQWVRKAWSRAPT